MSIKRVIVHIGVPKTGSTSIQDTLYFNRKYLEKCGFLYLRQWGINQSMALHSLLCENPFESFGWIKKYGLTEEDVRELNRRNEAELMIETSRTGCENLIVSAESLTYLKKEDVFRIKRFFVSHFGDIEFLILANVRNPVDILVSRYQQILGAPFGVYMDAKMFLGKSVCIFQTWLGNYLEAYPEECRIFDFHEAVKHPHGLVAHFLESAGLTESQISGMRFITSNESRCAELVEIFGFVNEKEPRMIPGEKSSNNASRRKDCLHSPFRRADDFYPLYSVKGAPFDLPYELKKEYRERCEEDLVWLKEKTGIDYLSLPIRQKEARELYSPETIRGFIQAFPKLTYPVKGRFLEFFESKHRETGDARFLPLFAPGSVPWRVHQFTSEFAKEEMPDRERKWVAFDGVRLPGNVDFGMVLTHFTEDGFTGSQKLQEDSEGRLRISLEFPVEDEVRKFCVEPSRFSGTAILYRLVVNGKSDNCKLERGNHNFRIHNLFSFFRDRPRLIFTCDETIVSLDIEIIYDCGGYAHALSAKLHHQRVANRLAELRRQNQTLRESGAEQAKTIADLKQRHQRRVKEADAAFKKAVAERDGRIAELEEARRELERKYRGTLGQRLRRLLSGANRGD